MCLKYHKRDGSGYYARLCYRAGPRRGEHVDLTPDQAENWSGCLIPRNISRRGRSGAATRRYTVLFDVGAATADEIADMARYMGTDRYTRDPVNGNVCFWVERGVGLADIRRAESFGWTELR